MTKSIINMSRTRLLQIGIALALLAMAGTAIHLITNHLEKKAKISLYLNPELEKNSCAVFPFTKPPFTDRRAQTDYRQTRISAFSQHFLKWHPDGNSIFFDYDTHPFTAQAIWKINSDGTGITKAAEPKQFTAELKGAMTAYMGSNYGFDADLSPNGNAIVHSACTDDRTKMAYPEDRQIENYDLAISTLNQSKPKAITTQKLPTAPYHLDVLQIHPTWSPDGTKIAYIYANSSNIYTYSTLSEPRVSIIQLDEDNNPQKGSKVGHWHLHTTRLHPPAWSPDGEKLAFLTKPHIHKDDHVRIYNITEQEIIKIEIAKDLLENGWKEPRWPISPPIWSPKDHQIAYASSGGDNHPEAIHITNADGTESQKISVTKYQDDITAQTQLAWHPVGTEILLMHRSLSSINLRDQTETVLLDREFFEEEERPMAVAWSPDGTQIALKTENQCGIKLLLMTRKGENVRTIAELKRPPIPGKETQKDPCTRSNPHAH